MLAPFRDLCLHHRQGAAKDLEWQSIQSATNP